jgi:hypothetical protein
MSLDLFQAPYEPTARPQSVSTLLNNHFKFVIEALPDLTFFAQSIQLPAVVGNIVDRPNPFRMIKEVADHLKYNDFDVSYKVDNAFKTYYSLYWWMCGYGFPRSYEEVEAFREIRKSRIANPRPIIREIEKTSAALYILQPDTNSTLVTVRYEDVFPVALGELQFESTDNEPVEVKCRVTFACNGFDIHLPVS